VAAQAANESMATTIIQYLLKEPDLMDVRQAYWSRNRLAYVDKINDLLHSRPFLLYAIESWAYHIRASGTLTASTNLLLRNLLISPTHRDGIMALTYFTKHHRSFNVPVCQARFILQRTSTFRDL
jgi:hypothetical protein